MRSKTPRLLLALALAVGTIPFVATAVAAQDRTCFTEGHYFTFKNAGSPTDLFDRGVADIDTSAGGGAFSICEPVVGDADDNGPSAWVAFVPGITNPQWGNVSAIFQVGVVKCASFGNGTCDGDANPPSYFWAFGGCDEAPFLRDLGPADYGSHEYKVAEGTSSWYVYIDGTSRGSILKTDDRVDCWINGDNEVQWAGEKWDKGDSLGNPGIPISTTALTFDDMKYSYDNNDNFTVLNTNGLSCVITDPVRDFCGFGWSGTGSMWAYTDQP